MALIRQNLISKFRKKAYRHGIVAAQTTDSVAAQIFSMRNCRGWSQSELAERTGMKQSRISVLENPSYDGASIKTLRRIAAAFDVAVIVRFVSFGELLGWVENVSEEQLNPPDFDHDPEFAPVEVARYLDEARRIAPSAIGGSAMNQVGKQMDTYDGGTPWLPSMIAQTIGPLQQLVRAQ